jgi:hypothetical protein
MKYSESMYLYFRLEASLMSGLTEAKAPDNK